VLKISSSGFLGCDTQNFFIMSFTISVSEEHEEKIYIPKRPNISLINSYRHTWKSRHNHYLRYSDVKPKDERRPTVTDLANQKQVLQKLNGWKIYHLSTQMEDLVSIELLQTSLRPLILCKFRTATSM
jgi:hypothetical protein